MKYLAFVSLIGLFIFVLIPSSALAQSGLTVDVDAGFDSIAKSDMILPIRVTISNQGPALSTELRITPENDWSEEHTFSFPLQLPQQSRKHIALNIPLQNTRRISTQLLDDQGMLLMKKSTSPQFLNMEDVLAGVVSSDGSLFNGLGGIKSALGGRIAVAHLDLQDLPETIQGWSALDMLILNDVDTSQLTNDQRDVLSYWVHGGGTLLVGGGPNAAQTLAGLSALIPFTEIALATLPHPLEDLDAYSQVQLTDQGPYVAALPAGLGSTNALVEADLAQVDSAQQGIDQPPGNHDGIPIISAWSSGAGAITYVAFDLSLAPMNQLGREEAFLTKLLGPFDTKPLSSVEIAGPASYAYSDGLRTSLALIPGSSLPRPLTVGIYLLIYVLAVGPLNYYILGRYKKREWTWVTLPLIVLLFCGIGYVRGYQLSGRQTILRQITVLHAQANNAQLASPTGTRLSTTNGLSPLRLDATDGLTNQGVSPLAEHGTFIGVFSSTRTEYQFEASDTRLIQPMMGGSNTNGLNVTYGAPTKVTNLRGDIGSMPTFLARGQVPAPDISANLIYRAQGSRVEGKIINNTGKPIYGAYLVRKDRGLKLDELPPGETDVGGRISLALSSYDMYGSNLNTGNPNGNSFVMRPILGGYPRPQAFLDPPDASSPEYVEFVTWASREMAVKSVLALDPNSVYSSGYPATRQLNGLHLVGWQDDSPVDVSLTSHGSRYTKETLLLIRIN